MRGHYGTPSLQTYAITQVRPVWISPAWMPTVPCSRSLPWFATCLRKAVRPIPEQGKWLRRVVRGYFNYHAVPTNGQAMNVFRHHVADLWRRTLRRRSQKDRITWDRMTQLANEWLPKPIILHPWPSDRFAVTHPRWEPYAGKPHVRFCAGGAQ
jgi:RNA-directed DNA polymerase